MRGLKCGLAVWTLLIAGQATAGTNPGMWTRTAVLDKNPLEAKLGTFGNVSDPDALAMVIWNDGISDHLSAVRIPPPYDGFGSSTSLVDSGADLYAMGDVCTSGSTVIVPYLKDASIELARFNGAVWSTETVADSTLQDYETVDCAVADSGFVLSANDTGNNKIDFFIPVSPGGPFGFYASYNDVAAPSNGGLRDNLAASVTRDTVFSLLQKPNGFVFMIRFDPTDQSPTFNEVSADLYAPPNGFVAVRDSAAALGTNHFYGTYNIGGTGYAVIGTAAAFFSDVYEIGPVPNAGANYPFQKATVIPVEGGGQQPFQVHMMWGSYYILNVLEGDEGTVATDPNYPLQNIGGPVDACLVSSTRPADEQLRSFVLGPHVGSPGTDLHIRVNVQDAIFKADFQSAPPQQLLWNCP